MDTEDGLASRILLGTGVTANALLQLMDELIYPGVGVAVMEEEGTTPKLEQLLEQAQRECAVCGMEQVGTEHLLLAMLKMQDCAGARLLNSLQINPQKLFSEIISAMGKEGVAYKEEFSNRGRKKNTAGEMPFLKQYARDLTQMALDDRMDPVIGRENEIQRMIQILSRRTKNNPCLIGEPGVGKTAIVEGLAQRIAEAWCRIPSRIRE